MLSCQCFSSWNNFSDLLPPDPDSYSLPSPLPQWPPGENFASGRIILGEIEVCIVNRFEPIWRWNPSQDRKKGVTFYKPSEIPDGFFCLGHYCQSNGRPLQGFLLVARELEHVRHNLQPALKRPLDYTLVWCPDDANLKGCGYFWFPEPPQGYKSLGFFVTDTPEKPLVDEMRVVRADLTDFCECHRLILHDSSTLGLPFRVWNTRPRQRGMLSRGVSVGTFFCSSYLNRNMNEDVPVACLNNMDHTLHAMPNLNQIHALINHYGPTFFFHPDELYLPCSLPWFFKNGSRLCTIQEPEGVEVDEIGSNLPSGGTNDGKYWIDLTNERIKFGNLDSAELYVHMKPSLGGTFTDIAMWVFFPFNGPATVKFGVVNIGLSKIGQHVGDWEHVTLHVSNFTGELHSIYFSQHSGGRWVDACDLEFVEGNRAAVYSSKNGHASFPRPGTYLQGSERLGVGIRNDAARSNLCVDSSTRYEIVAAEYLGDGVVDEPCWLQYMGEWGPVVVYGSRTELDRIINAVPVRLRASIKRVLDGLPLELYGERGPTGPKEKNNWLGDERG